LLQTRDILLKTVARRAISEWYFKAIVERVPAQGHAPLQAGFF